MSEADLHARLALAQRYARSLSARLGTRAIQVAREQASAAEGDAEASWQLVLAALERD